MMTGIRDLQTIFTATQNAEGAGAAGAGARRTHGGTQDTALGGVDRAAVSSAGEGLRAALGESDVRMEKVLALQGAIASGSYQVPAGQVADALISSMLQGPVAGRR